LRRLEIKVFQGCQTANSGWQLVSDSLQSQRMAFVSHPQPTLSRLAGESARPRLAAGAQSRPAVAALPSPRARVRRLRGPAGAAAAVTAGGLRETPGARHREGEV